jgi:hypothetical protein
VTAIRLRRDRFMVRLALLASTVGALGLALSGVGWASVLADHDDGLYWMLAVVGTLLVAAAAVATLWVLVEAAPVRLGPDGIAVRAAGRPRLLPWSEVKRISVQGASDGDRTLALYPIHGGHAVLGRSGGMDEPVLLGSLRRSSRTEAEVLAAIERWSGLLVED